MMSFLQPNTSVNKIVSDYKNVDLEVDTEKIHELDQIEFHRQSSEMLYSTVATKAMIANKIQNTILNIQDQMNMDKASL